MAYLNNHHSRISASVQRGQKAGHRIHQASQFASIIKRIYDNGIIFTIKFISDIII